MRTRMSQPVQHPLRWARSPRVFLSKIDVSNFAAPTMAAMALVALAACSATAPNAVAGSAKTPAAEVSASRAPRSEAPRSEAPISEAPISEASTSGSPSAGPKPAGKISADMVGKVSPIPAFKGQGRGWRIDIHALDATQHHVALRWAETRATDSGTAIYRGSLQLPRANPLALDGRLQTRGGAKTLRIEIHRERCIDIDGTERPQRIVVTIEGRPGFEGCGDSAVY
jgi:hypothetical protein